MVREHHVAVLPVNHVSVLCIGLCVSGGSHVQYTYMIDPGAQPYNIPRACKDFSLIIIFTTYFCMSRVVLELQNTNFAFVGAEIYGF